jgi:hypothetical protein
VRQVQRDLQINEAFICDRGAALYVPTSYFRDRDPHVTGEREIFKLNPPDKSATVSLVRDLFLGLGSRDVLTIGRSSSRLGAPRLSPPAFAERVNLEL